MTTYLILDGQLRAETDAEVIANLRRKGWADAPAKPSDDAQWQDGAWIVPPAPTFTAEQIVSQHFSPYQIAALQRFELGLMQAQKPLGEKMSAVKTWLELLLLSWSEDPTPKAVSHFGQAPYSFAEASAEAAASLTSN